MTEQKNKSYAGQIFIAKRTTQMLSITDRLCPVTEEDDEPYLEVFSGKSVYLASILKIAEKTSVIANIPLKDLFELRDSADHANRIIFEQAIRGSSSSQAGDNGSAFLKFGMGRFKGRSPGEMLLNTQNAAEVISNLRSHLSFLKDNLPKFPNNQTYIDSINDAIRLYEQGKLCKTEADHANIFDIYSPPVKYFRQTNPEGTKNKCYSIKISCRIGNAYPYHIEIKNFYAPIGHKSSGITPILFDGSEHETSASIDLTKQEFIHMLEKMHRNYVCFFQMLYQGMREEDRMRQWKPDRYH